MINLQVKNSESQDNKSKKVELPFLLLLSAIVVAKIALQLAVPDSTPEAQWKKADPKAASVYASNY
jgi:hypothetical protein